MISVKGKVTKLEGMENPKSTGEIEVVTEDSSCSAGRRLPSRSTGRVTSTNASDCATLPDSSPGAAAKLILRHRNEGCATFR